MPRKLRLGYALHSLRSDWNNGNAHFLRGLLREMGNAGHDVTAFEQARSWSLANLQKEPSGRAAVEQFGRIFPDLHVTELPEEPGALSRVLRDLDVVLVHEWTSPEMIGAVLRARDQLGFKALFHDTHHRASSTPEAVHSLQVSRFDGVIAFGESLRAIYEERFGVKRTWTLHEAADTSVFFPRQAEQTTDVVWIGNWGDDERAQEISAFLLGPASRMRARRFAIHGVRYPDHALATLHEAGVAYRGYLPNLDAPQVYAASNLTVHIPRQQYTAAMRGIPTIRVFEALASGIPLISAPWEDTEDLFRPDDLRMVHSTAEMKQALCELLEDPARGRAQAERGLETVLSRHTCRHRAEELTAICEEVLG